MGRPVGTVAPRALVGRAAWHRLAALVAVAGLVACEPETRPVEPEPESKGAVFTPVGYESLPGWTEDRHSEAIPALLRSCDPMMRASSDKPLGASATSGTVADLAPICRAAAALPAGDDAAARDFFMSWFQPFAVSHGEEPEGLITGYFEIEVNGAIEPNAAYSTPIYRKPDDHVTVDLGGYRQGGAHTPVALQVDRTEVD